MIKDKHKTVEEVAIDAYAKSKNLELMFMEILDILCGKDILDRTDVDKVLNSVFEDLKKSDIK